MRLKNNTAHDLYNTMVDSFVEEIQEVGSGDCTERLAEILKEDYPTWSEEKCKSIAQQFFDEHYNEAYDEARESFEPSPLEEAMADLRAGRL